MPQKIFNSDNMPATSTPNVITGRRSIHKDKTISPIFADINNERRDKKIESSVSSNSSDSSETEDTYSTESSRNISKCELDLKYQNLNPNKHVTKLIFNEKKGILIIPAVVIACALSLVVANFLSTNEPDCNLMTVKELYEKFPSQSQDTFDAIVSGVNEVKMFNKPSVFLLLYEHKALQTVNDFIQVVALYASNVINDDCKANPIVLTTSTLNSAKAKNDYGYIISTYKPALENRTVMVVKNLEKVSGFVARAFHSICDEYSPLVKKSVIIFTMELKGVDRAYKSDYQLVESILRKSWSDLDEDIFNPLYTRIVGMILRIQPESRRL